MFASNLKNLKELKLNSKKNTIKYLEVEKKETVVDEEITDINDPDGETDSEEETAANRAFNAGARAGMDHTMEEG